MLNPDDIDPPPVACKPVDLQSLSIGDLKDYIVSLESEIGRAKAMIDKKEAHRNGAEGLFKR